MKRRQALGYRTSEYQLFYDLTWARDELLRAIERVAQPVLGALRDDLLPKLAAMNLSSRPGYQDLRFDPELQEPVLAELRDCIARWGDTFHLSGHRVGPHKPGDVFPFMKWIESPVLYTLLDWAERLPHNGPLAWTFPDRHSVGAHLGSPEPFEFSMDGWPVLRESKPDFTRRAREHVEQALHDYIRRREAEAGRMGWVRLPARFSESHFEMLVRFQVLRQSQNQIAAICDVKRGAVGPAIAKAARMVIGTGFRDWLMPPLPPGRRRHPNEG